MTGDPPVAPEPLLDTEPEASPPEPLTPERVQAIQERLRRETAEMGKPRHRRRL